MTVSRLDIEQIVKKAIFISEYFDHQQFQVDFGPVNEQQASQRLEQWCKVIAQGNWEKFQKRLEWNGWDIEQVRQTFGRIPVLDSQTLPSWATTLTEIIQTISEITSNKISPSLSAPENPLPFEDILLPLIVVARRKLLNRWNLLSLSPEDLSLKLLSEPAYLKLENALLKRLFNITGSALDFEFSKTRTVGENLLNLVLNTTEGTSSKVKYNAFVNKLLSDGLLGFFQNYPVLGRLIATAIEFWVAATGEFVERLNADSLEIQQVFGSAESKLGKVIEITAGLSDSHHQDHSVIALTFESGLKLIYKPKNLALEVAFCQFLNWVNNQPIINQTQGINESFIPFKVLNILNRDTYGWVEYVEQQPCKDETAAQCFYLRSGMLLCLLYLLGGTDCHNENLIASGEYPVLIDMETVMHHEAKVSGEISQKTATLVATEQLNDSVLRTGLLPMWEFGVERSIAFDLSGLGSVEAQPIPIPVPTWKFINTDDMRKGYEMMDRPLQANIPTLNGVALSPNRYLRELVTGFEQMYRFLIQQRDTLLKSNSPLAAFRSQQVRYIFRQTRAYGRILHKSMEPEALRNGINWSIELDNVSRSFLNTHEKPQNWSVLSAELRELEQLDIPYFSAFVDSDALTLEPGVFIANYFKASCYSQMLARLQKLSEADLARQLEIIQLVFQARVARTIPTNPGDINSAETGDYSRTPLTAQQLLQQAEDIATEIQKQAIHGTDGSLTWISLNYMTTMERWQLQPLGETLYDGTGGVALFLAALARIKGSSQLADLALTAISPIQEVLSNSTKEYTQDFAKELGIGGASGVGSIIYYLVKISQLVETPKLCEDAMLAAQLITSEIIATDSKFDIVGGSAGAILGLLALYKQTGSAEVLQGAIACGQHLLKYCDSAYSPQAGNSPASKPQTGFSHGAAGIAYSLLQLYAVTQDSSYLEGARQGIAYESSVFSPSARNWPIISPMPSASPVFWSTWCYGAPSIALGRLAGASIYQTEEVLRDIEVGLNTTQKTALQDIDHLCCGNLGRAEVLLVAGQKLSNPFWYQAAQELAAMVVGRAARTGKYQLFSELPISVSSPGFFQGMAGIGYQLLRLGYPESLPSVLLWE
jgi:type 2 lantibiotic biosynthesis protein LanM